MKKILYFASAVLALVAVSCSKYEITDAGHEAGEPDVEGCYKVYFPEQEASGDHTYDPTMDPKVEITVVRANAKGAITVPYTLTASNDSIFTGTPIKFEHGQDTTTFVVSFPNAKADGTKYSFSVKISDPQYASKYADFVTDLDFSVMRVEYKKFATGTLTICAPLGVTNVKKCEMWYYEVGNVRYCKLNDGLKLGDYVADYNFTWNTQTNTLYIPVQKSGYTSSDIDIYLSDGIGFYEAYYGSDYWAGSTKYSDWADYCAKNGYIIAKYDGNGGFYLADFFYYDVTSAKSGYGWQFGGDTIKDCDSFICDGFDRTDYSVYDVTTDYAVKGVTAVEVEAGKSVKTLKYACAAGELTATQAGKLAQNIFDGTAKDVKTATEYEYDSIEDKNYFDFNVSFETTGTYSLVAVAASSDSTFNYSFETFEYVAAGDVEEYKVKLTVATEDISPRWGYDKTKAFQYYVLGKDIEKLHMMIVYTEAYKANKAKYDAAIKATTDSDYIADDDIIEAVNGEGGFSSFVYDVSPLTSYTVLVWAANAVQDGIFTAEYTTDGLPREFITKGVYTYNLYWKGDDTLSLYKDPNYEDTFVLTPFGNGSELTFTYNSNTSEVSVQASYIGVDYQGVAPIYAIEGSLVYSKYAAYKSSCLGVNTYKFFVAYYVPALGAGFGANFETFVPLAPQESSAASVASALKKSSCASYKSLSEEYPVKTLPAVRAPKNYFKPVEHDPLTVGFTSTPGSRLPKKESSFNGGCTMAPEVRL